MSATAVAEHILLGLACLVVVLSCVGVAAARTAYDRLHFQGPVAVLAAPLIAAAIVVSEGFDVAGVSACMVSATLLLLAPFVTHVEARAMRIHEEGGWRIRAEEIPEAYPEQEPGT